VLFKKKKTFLDSDSFYYEFSIPEANTLRDIMEQNLMFEILKIVLIIFFALDSSSILLD